MTILASFAVPHPPIILPEIGRGEEKKIQKTIDAYDTVMKAAADLNPDTLVITSPHAELYLDYFHIAPGSRGRGSFAQFRAPQVEIAVDYDTTLASLIADDAQKAGIPAGFEGERNPELDHAIMIPLYFFRKYKPLDQVKVVRIGLSGFPADVHYKLGQCIRRAVDQLPDEMRTTRAGAFVSLHLHGQLRGCIGTISPVRSCVAEEILQNGISAATRDPRFPPVQPWELSDLEYNVDVLGKPEPVADASQLDPKKYGVIVKSSCDERKGLLLPDLDRVDTTAEQISIARQKGNIGVREPIELYRFQVVRHK